MILAGDAGASKTELAVFEKKNENLKKIHSQIYQSKEYDSLESIVIGFFRNNNFKIDHACIGIPAPVIDGKAKATNINWDIDEKKISAVTGIKNFRIINDLAALSASVLKMPENKFIEVYGGKNSRQIGNKAILAPGTGLGQAAMIYDGEKYITIPTEGGHADFAPVNETETELLKYLLKKYDHVSYEKIASGTGLPNIYDFLVSAGYGNSDNEINQRFLSEDKAKVITDEALSKSNQSCMKAVEIFISVLGSQAGNMVLNYNAVSGVYLGGGIPLKLKELFFSETFMKSYLCKGKLCYLPESAPVYIINDASAGTYGAAVIAAEQ